MTDTPDNTPQARIDALEAELAFERHKRHLAELNVRIMGRQLHLAQDRAEKWEEIAHTDALTGVYNRLGGQREISREINRRAELPAEQRGHLELLFIDLDRFGLINKVHGDQSGDEALQKLASKLRSCLRETDFVARKGGDEFIVVLSGTSEEGVDKVIDKITKALDGEISIMSPRGVESVRGSFGRVEWDDTLDLAGNMMKADELMRERKAARKEKQRLENPDYREPRWRDAVMTTTFGFSAPSP